MILSKNITYRWILFCFLALFNECISVESKSYPLVERPSSRHRYISRSWSDWSLWSSCSRTCGGGIRQRTRICKLRMVGYSVSSESCIGDSIDHELCSRHACPLDAEEFLDSQCSKHNGQWIGGKEVDQWIPYRYGKNPCELQCWPKDRSVIHSFGKVVDGTKCLGSNPRHPALCVNGRCVPVDCAGYLGTDNRRDKCGVCRGSNSTCVRYQNTLWSRPRTEQHADGRKDRHYDYNEIFSIPAGATHVLVSEVSDTNFLVLADHNRNRVINGNWRVQSPGRFVVDGSEFIYNRTWDGHDQLTSEGPTRFVFNVLVLGSGDVPTIHYEYWLSTSNHISRSTPRQLLYPYKALDSSVKPQENSQTYHPFENIIESSSSEIKLLPVTKFQGYKSYYHRNEILNSVPSWSIKRHSNLKHSSHSSIEKSGFGSTKWRNQTNDQGRHFENPRIAVGQESVIQVAQHHRVSTVLPPLSSTRIKNSETTTPRWIDLGRPNGTSAFTRYNQVNLDVEDRVKSQLPDLKKDQLKAKKNGEKNEKKALKKHEEKRMENKRFKRKKKSDYEKCPRCSRTRHQNKNFCTSDFVLRVTVLATEKQQQNIRFDLEVTRSYKNKVPILSREYIWTSDDCLCPKLQVGQEYILMGHSSVMGGKRESKLMVDRNSFVRQFTQKRARTMLRLVRDKISLCKRFETI